MSARLGDWMQTRSGLQYWPLDPRVEDVKLTDIAHALSNLCRYNGHCNGFYSVAEHSVLVSQVVPPEHALCGLLHDATEAYCADVPRPLKRNLVGYADIEHKNWLVVAAKFGLPVDMPESVHIADNAVLLAEKQQIVKQTPHLWSVPGTAANVQIKCLSPNESYSLFIDRFMELI